MQKKRILTRILTGMLSVITIISNSVPMYASESETQTTSEEESQNTDVLYEQDSTYEITIPKTIALGEDKTSTYSVKVNGDIASDKSVYVSPVDSVDNIEGINFYMKDQSTVSPKADVLANVTQEKTTWLFNEVAEGLETTDNTVSATDLSSGSWKGIFSFEINMKSVSSGIGVVATDSEGTDLSATATIIDGEEKDNLLAELENSGLVNSASDVSALVDIQSDSFDDLANAVFDVSNIAEEGDKVVILHYDETVGEWEYIGEDTVDKNGEVSGDFTSFSPVAFVKVSDDGTYEHIHVWNDEDNCACGETMPGIPITYVNREQFGITPDITEYTVPETIQVDGVEYKVTTITDHAFDGCSNLKSVELNDNIRNISNAFQNSGIESISIPSSVEYAEFAFQNCTNLTSVTFEDEGSRPYYLTLTNTFENCINLDNIVLPKGKCLGLNAFSGCTSLSNITLSETEVTIPANAFYGCTSLTNIDIPDSVTSIGGRAFYGCTNLKKLVIPNGVRCISESAFMNCTSLTTIELTDSITGIDMNAFSGCTNLTTIEIPDYIYCIGSGAFSGCTKLDVTIPDGAYQIDDGAFTDVKHITYHGTATGAPWGALSMN